MYVPILIIVLKLFRSTYVDVYQQVKGKLIKFFVTFLLFKTLRITLYFEICFLRDNDFIAWAKFVLFVSEIVISTIILWIGLKNMDDYSGLDASEDASSSDNRSANNTTNRSTNFAQSIVRRTNKTVPRNNSAAFPNLRTDDDIPVDPKHLIDKDNDKIIFMRSQTTKIDGE